MGYRHFVFDLDGTLIDSRQDLADSANALLATYGAAPLPVADIVRMVGEGARTLVERVLHQGTVTADIDIALTRFLDLYDERLLVHTRPYDGVESLLDFLRSEGCVSSVLTNKPQRATERVLEGLGLRPALGAVIGGDTVHGRKPDPTGLLALVAATGLAPESTVMVGDSWVDLQTAAGGGIDACLAAYGFGALELDAATRRRARVVVDAPDAIRRLAHAHPPAPSRPPATRA